ncbi:MAG: hypothetical protein L0215_01565 [Gemmataceae bacterium]|nr:hypothetical protein [Gemmataceae bacterium]
MGMLSWLRRLFETPSSRDVVVEHPWGDTREWIEGNCRIVQWSVLAQSWPELEPIVDEFLAASVDAVSAAYSAETVPWMVLHYDVLTGSLHVVPAADPAEEQGDKNVELSLNCLFLETEAERNYGASSGDDCYELLYDRFWKMVRNSLREGEASRKLATARKLHPLRIAGLNAPTGCDEEPVEDLDI